MILLKSASKINHKSMYFGHSVSCIYNVYEEFFNMILRTESLE